MVRRRRDGGRALAVATALAFLACSPLGAPPPPGATVAFDGKVARSETIQGARRFNAGAQGVWFRLGSGDPAKYHYFVPTIEEGLAAGVLARQADGEVRYVDLEGRRVSGTATVRSDATRDVVALRVLE